MENKEAIEMLKRIQNPEPWDTQITRRAYEALDMAISALDKQERGDWIPCAERLPEEYGEYRITWKTSVLDGRFIGDAEYEPGLEWDDAHDRFFGEWLLDDYIKAYTDVEVIAWKPIEDPYTPLEK